MITVEVFEEIDAPPAVVWDVLLEFEAYPEWNPLIRAVEGVPTEGEDLTVRVQLPESRPLTFSAEVVAAEERRRLAWLGRLVVPFAIDGYHEFHLEPVGERGDRTRLLNRETFRGALVPLVVDEETIEAGFAAMNRALRERAEARVPVQS